VDKRIPVLACLGAALLFGASTPVAKALLSGIGPFTLAGLLYLGAALGVAPFCRRGGDAALRRAPEQRGRLLGAVVFGGILGPVLMLFGLMQSTAASVALWLNGEVVATVILAWAFFRDRIGGRGLVAAACVLGAGILLVVPEGAAGARAGSFVMLACVCWGLDNNLTSLICGFTPAQTTFVKGLVAGSINLLLGLVLEREMPGLSHAVGALALGAIAYGASILLYITGAHQLGAARAQLLFAAGPFLGAALSWLALREPVQSVQLLAAPLMVGGLALLLTGRHEHGHEHAPESHTHRHRHDDGHHEHEHEGSVAGWHTHAHEHVAMRHAHAHVPDLHHRHGHD
jgi:drug/metabolite transporter (DMT)-like permease